MNAQIHPSLAELTTPLVSPDVLAGFEALANGRCSLAALSDTVLTACSADPSAAEGVLQLLESYEDSEEFERFDFGPLKHALERGEEESEEASTRDSVERDDQYDEMPVLAPIDEPRMLRGRYVLETEIGRGGAGIVYRALDLNRTGLPPGHNHVALKILGENAARSPDAVDALRREYHQAQSLSHPGIVNVFDFDHDGDTYFVTMELLDGESLGELTRRLPPNKLPHETATRILRELGDSIVYAHDRGVLHLDLKPDNVMIDADGRVRVLDFGIARPERDIPQLGSAPPAAATPAYASCERLMQERPDVRDDVFSFSCIVYELLAGTHPFDRCSALNARKDGRKPRRIRSLSRRQWAALERGLAWAREDRPANMRALLRGLALHSSPPPEAATQRVAWQRAAAVALIGLVAAAILSWAGIQYRTRSLDQRSATAVAAEPASARESADTDRRTPEVVAAATVSSDPEFEAAAPATSAPALQLEPAAAVVTPVSAIDAQVESAVLDAEPIRRPPKPRADTTSETLVAASRPTAEASDELGFSRHSFSVSEADSAVRVNVRRRGGAAGDIAFQWYTVDDSARAGQDYIYGFGEVRMAPGQTTATFDVPIVEDTIREDPELLQVIIGSSRGAHVGAAGRAPVIIVDDD